MNQIFINTDGGSRGNPGPAAIGVVIADLSENIIHTFKQAIGIATNNEAEYRAIIEALKILKSSSAVNMDEFEAVVCRLDSMLVVEQVSGNWKIKQPHIAKFNLEIHQLIKELDLPISFTHIPREQNKLADKLVNEALDEAKN